MADDDFRPYRSRDQLPRDGVDPAATDANDPLAQLARLIGQSDPYAEANRSEAYSSERPAADAEAPRRDWPTDEREDRADRHYDPHPASLPPASYDSYAPQERGYEDEPPNSSRYFSGSVAQFTGFRDETGADDHGEQKPFLRTRELPAYATAEPDDDYAPEEPDHDGDETYAADDHYDDRPGRRRGGVVVVMTVLSLVVIGTAGAFGYRAMFGGSMLPTLPPIIKANNGPTRIVPNYGDSQANKSSQAGVPSAGSTEHLVSREEQPVNIEPPKAAPRIVSTIPVISGQSAAPPGLTGPAGQVALAPNSPWPPAPAPTSAPPIAAALPTPAQVSTEPKRIHTVTIRADQAGPSNAMPVAPPPQQPPPVARSMPRPAPSAPKPSAVASIPRSGPNAPLSIVPASQGETAASPPAHTRAAAAPMAVASAGPIPTPAASQSSSGGSFVQVTSQRSEAEAQAAFRTLQGRFPNQLGGREAIIRRADLGAKGTYYRALVGPFASTQAAAGMCSSLKVAGGNCLVQRN